jgi:hypothetical protein
LSFFLFFSINLPNLLDILFFAPICRFFVNKFDLIQLCTKTISKCR